MIDEGAGSKGRPAMTTPDGSQTLNSSSQNCATISRTASDSSASGQTASASSTFPPPKTDKPRPHVCTTCSRCFARLEHLKRHERSHTKEKPFECPECSRCFARRDLLLRHQQKLHSTTTPSSRPRTGRRDSNVGSGRVRKNSVAHATSAGMRPRANTLSHLDANSLDLLATSRNTGRNANAGHSHRSSDPSVSRVSGYQYRGLSTTHHNSLQDLPRLNTSALPAEHSGGLRTAPAYGEFSNEFATNAFVFGPGNTINPNQLHMGDLPAFGIDDSNFQYPYPGSSNHHVQQDGENFGWVAQGFGNQRFFNQANESAIETSSPSVVDTNSPDGVSDGILDGGTSIMNNLSASAGGMWNASMISQAHMMPGLATLDFPPSTFNDMVPAPNGTISPKSLLAQGGSLLEMNLPNSPPLNPMDPPFMVPGFVAPGSQVPIGRAGGASTASSSSIDSGLPHSSITTVSAELIDEHTRSTVLTSLLQHSSFGQRPHTQPTINSPLSPNSTTGSKNLSLHSFPSSTELQRYCSAYVQYFHPHLPFLHIPSLDFDSPEYSVPSRMINRESHLDHNSISGGGGCLLLAITAIGALYERDMAASKQLFDAAKHMIGGFLEERRRANLCRNGPETRHSAEAETTPLWLVQAMLLNVIYGYNCGERTSADIASNHCATLVSLARGAELARPYPGYMVMTNGTLGPSVQMNGLGRDGWNSITNETDDNDWYEWKAIEERKRTLYAVFILSSLLVSAYNHPPALTNSEIRLDLPCEEGLWAAETATIWRSMGGFVVANSHPIMFNAALGHLLTAAQRQHHQPRSSDAPSELGVRMQNLPESDLKPSTFGCLILINALHNYIWETRQRHLGREWTSHDTEQMHSHIEPALRAWQASWASNPTHSLERPNPFGAGPLSADCIPLLDLAYVRLFVNFGRSKEALWQRDYDTIANGLYRTADLGYYATHSASSGYEETNMTTSTNSSGSRCGSAVESNSTNVSLHNKSSNDGPVSVAGSEIYQQPEQLALRERYLRKAAFYAADSLAMSDKLGISFANQTSRELPLQSAMCAFDCAQVLAEWVGTVQDRVGRYIGIIDGNNFDSPQIASLVFLEDEDRNLLEKVSQVLHRSEATTIPGPATSPSNHFGCGSRILLSTAQMLDRAAVWPVTNLMARSLEAQAARMKDRALASIAVNV